MRNSRLLPYETIVQATTGEPEAVNAVLQHYYERRKTACTWNSRGIESKSRNRKNPTLETERNEEQDETIFRG